MAIAFVQDDHLVSDAVTQQVIAFGSNVAAGSAIVVAGGGSTGQTISSISDTLGNTYALVKSQGGDRGMQLWAAVNSGAGANSVTVNWSASNNPQTYIAEYSGVLTTSVAAAVDQTGGNNTVAVTAHPCHTTTLTPSEADCLVIGAGRFSAAVSYSSGETGYTQRTGSAGGPAARCLYHDLIQTTAAATDADMTTTASATGDMVLAILKSAPLAGGQPAIRRHGMTTSGGVWSRPPGRRVFRPQQAA